MYSAVEMKCYVISADTVNMFSRVGFLVCALVATLGNFQMTAANWSGSAQYLGCPGVLG